MKSVDVANMFIARHGGEMRLTNLSLNKLVYFAQVESLRALGRPLFDDDVEAWDYGPVEPEVYRAFKGCGSSIVREQARGGDGVTASPEETAVVDTVAERYGRLTAFDLVEITHRTGSAWSRRYRRGANAKITADDIRLSADMEGRVDFDSTLSAGIRSVQERWPNALRLLGDA